MRKITRETSKAFKSGQTMAMGNSQTDGEHYYLHGKCIAYFAYGGLCLTMAGWPTPTTRERLNGILETLGIDAGFYQSKNVQYFQFGNDKPIEISPDQIIKVQL